VTASGVSALRDEPNATARISWRVEAGVVGRVDDCQKGWCRLDVSGRSGYIEAEKVWGEEVL
jgi:SH3-like domain-containing protein